MYTVEEYTQGYCVAILDSKGDAIAGWHLRHEVNQEEDLIEAETIVKELNKLLTLLQESDTALQCTKFQGTQGGR